MRTILGILFLSVAFLYPTPSEGLRLRDCAHWVVGLHPPSHAKFQYLLVTRDSNRALRAYNRKDSAVVDLHMVKVMEELSRNEDTNHRFELSKISGQTDMTAAMMVVWMGWRPPTEWILPYLDLLMAFARSDAYRDLADNNPNRRGRKTWFESESPHEMGEWRAKVNYQLPVLLDHALSELAGELKGPKAAQWLSVLETRPFLVDRLLRLGRRQHSVHTRQALQTIAAALQEI